MFLSIKESSNEFALLEKQHPFMLSKLRCLQLLKNRPLSDIGNVARVYGVDRRELERMVMLYRVGGIKLLCSPDVKAFLSSGQALSYSSLRSLLSHSEAPKASHTAIMEILRYSLANSCPQVNCATPNSLINDPPHKKLFEDLWGRTMASGEENGAAIFYEQATNTYHKITLSEGEHMKIYSTDRQRVITEVPTMPRAKKEINNAIAKFTAENRHVLFMAFYHTHPNYKATGNPMSGDPSGGDGDLGIQADFGYPLGIIRTGNGYFFFMDSVIPFRSDDPRANKCIWELIKEQRQK